MITLITWLRECDSFLCYSFSFPLFFHTVLTGKIHYVQLTWNLWGIMSHLLEGKVSINYLKYFCTEYLCPLPFTYSFNDLSILVSTNWFLFYALDYNPILLYLFHFSNFPALGIGNSFIWFLFLFEILPSLRTFFFFYNFLTFSYYKMLQTHLV